MAKTVGIRSREALQLGFSHFLIDSQISLLAVSMPFVIRDLRLSFAEAGIIVGASIIFAAVPQPMTGYLSDRISRKNLLALGLVICGVGSILTSRSPQFFSLLASQCLVGVSSSIFHPLGYSSASYLSNLSYRGRTLGLLSGSGDLGMLVVFSSTGPLSLVVGWREVFLIWGFAVLMFSAAFVFFGSISSHSQDRPKKETSTWSGRIRAIGPELVFMVLLSLINRILLSFLPTYLFEIGISESSAAVSLGALVGLGIIGELTGGSLADRFGPQRVISTLMASLSLISLLIYLIRSGTLLPIIAVVAGFPLFAAYPCIYSASSRITGGSRGVAYGLLLSVGWVGSALGPPMGGALGDLYGLRVIFLIIAVISLVASGYAARFVKAH